MSLDIVILAAGMGKRMQSSLPKVLHSVAGKPLLKHVIDTARSLNAGAICVIYGHGGDQVLTAVAADDLRFAKQEPQLGTGHAVAQAIPVLDDSQPTLVLYGDVPLTTAASLQRLISVAGNDKLAILTAEMTDPTGLGRIVRENGEIRRIVEQKDATEAERQITEINTGIMIVPTVKLKEWLATLSNNNAQGEYYLTDIVGLAVADGVSVSHAQPSAGWETLGVNSRVQQAQLERVWQGEQARVLLEQGVTLADPARFDLRGALACGRDVFIDVGCVFEGEVHLADGVRIGPHCVIRDARIGAGTVLDAYTHVEGARVAEAARIGPYARLRPGADIGPDAHVGNFVELKKTRLGRGSKANHLAYLGDASVGERVNYGAGSITANYDGANKHRTTIGADVHVGSNCVLVAPVTLGDGATIGGGSTITKDVAPGQLAVARGRQTAISGWQRPVKKR